MTVTLLLPAYNEEMDLPLLLQRIKRALSETLDYRVIVVDDGSQDRTAKICLDAATHMPLILIQHPANMGLGAAMRTGLKAAALFDGPVITLDADNSQDPELIPTLLTELDAGADLVIASRFRPGAKEVGVPAHRVFLSHLSSGVIRNLVRVPEARDYTCGFRAYRVDKLRELITLFGDNFLRENGFSCMLELLLNLRRLDITVAEVPLVLRYDMKAGASKMRIFRTCWRYLVTIIRGYLPLPYRQEPAWARELRQQSVTQPVNATLEVDSLTRSNSPDVVS